MPAPAPARKHMSISNNSFIEIVLHSTIHVWQILDNICYSQYCNIQNVAYTNASFDNFGRYETDTFVLSHKNQKRMKRDVAMKDDQRIALTKGFCVRDFYVCSAKLI